MKNILEQINENRLQQVIQLKKRKPITAFNHQEAFHKPVFSVSKSVLSKEFAVISEFKKASPSKGIINKDAQVVEVTVGYEKAGAAAVSILTEPTYFKGNDDDLIAARPHLSLPILRKDFIVDAYQIAETKAMGADVLLLIAASLSVQQAHEYAAYAKEIGLEILLEIHEESELKHISKDVDLVGVNNRSLKTFEVDINTSLKLLPLIPSNKIPISESGLSSIQNIKTLHQAGFKGFLMGEAFMKHSKPQIELQNLLSNLAST
jgi:indole-3-glycerol phosphate synthase